MSNVKDQLKTRLEDRGLRLSPADLSALLEEISPKASHVALSYMVDLLRPFSAGMGFRVTRLSDSQIELLIPSRTRNKNENGEIHEGALLAGVLEAARLLWERHAPLGDFKMDVTKQQMEIFRHTGEEVRIRLELAESLRESVLAEVRKTQRGRSEMRASVYDHHDQTLAEVQLHLEFSHIPSLGTSSAGTDSEDSRS